MGDKKQFVLRMSPEMHDAIQKWAADEFRSANGQVEWILHQALKKAGRLPGAQKETKKPDQDKNS